MNTQGVLGLGITTELSGIFSCDTASVTIASAVEIVKDCNPQYLASFWYWGIDFWIWLKNLMFSIFVQNSRFEEKPWNFCLPFTPFIKYCQYFSEGAESLEYWHWLPWKCNLQRGARFTDFKLSIFAILMSKEEKVNQTSTSKQPPSAFVILVSKVSLPPFAYIDVIYWEVSGNFCLQDCFCNFFCPVSLF